MTRVLTERELNRALLARQLLLGRDAERSTFDTIEHLGGLQAQEPKSPYLSLHARLADFDPASLEVLLERRDAVRVNVMRATIHLVTAREAPALRALHADVLRTRVLSAVGRELPGIDVDELAAAARPLFDAAEPVGMTEVGRALAPRFPPGEAQWLGIVAAAVVPVVHATPRGLWRRSGRARLTLLARWLDGRADAVAITPEALLRRYLAAFGPATPADFTAWSGLPGARALCEQAEDLVTYEDEQGRTLHDLPGAPLPPADTPAPPRLLGEFDNATLGHQDRARILPHAHRRLVVAGQRAVLVDGYVAGTWTLRDGELAVETFRPLPAEDKRALREEAKGVLDLAGAAKGRVRIRSGTGRTTTATPSRTR